MDLKESGRLKDLRLVLKEAAPCAVLFSGGFDSEVLLRFACRVLNQERVLPVTAVSPLLAGYYTERIAEVIRELGLSPETVRLDVMDRADFRSGGALRCYICKKTMYGMVKKLSLEKGFSGVIDGTTTDDLGEDRPGLRAASEEGIIHPFVEAGMGNREVEILGESFGLRKSDLPSDSCLATRITGSVPITRELLKQVEEMESDLRPRASGRVRIRLERGSFIVEYTQKDRKMILGSLEDLRRKAKLFERDLILDGPE